MSVSSVERGLRQAIARVSEYVQRGKGAGRKAIYAIGLFLAGRKVFRAGMIVVVTATAGAVVSAQPVLPPQLAPVERATVPAVTLMQPYAPIKSHIVDVVQAGNAVAVQVAAHSITVGGLQVSTPEIDAPAVSLPAVNLPAVNLPPLPIPPIHGPLGA